MIKLKYLVALLAIVAATACKQKTTDGYRVSGVIENMPEGSEVYLDEVAYAEAKPIDTVKLGKNGSFEIHGNAKEEGLYRLRFELPQTVPNRGDIRNEQSKYILLVIDSLTKEVVVSMDTFNIFKKTYSVKGSPKSETMRKLLTDINQRNETLGQLMAGASDSTAADSVLQSGFEEYQAKAMEARQYVINFADTVNSPVLAIFAAANFLNPQTDLQEINALSKKLATRYPSNGLVAAFHQSLQPRADNPIGQGEDPNAPKQMFANGTPLPDINGQTPNGQSMKLSSLRGKFVLVDFWASWCRPCRMENPTVVNVYNKYKDKGFAIYSVSLDDKKDKWVEAIAQDKLAWEHHVSDLKGWQSAYSGQFGITSIPTNYLIDGEGNVLAFNLRGAELEAALAQLIQ